MGIFTLKGIWKHLKTWNTKNIFFVLLFTVSSFNATVLNGTVLTDNYIYALMRFNGRSEVRTRLEPGWAILVEVTTTIILGFGLKENVRCHLFVHFLTSRKILLVVNCGWGLKRHISSQIWAFSFGECPGCLPPTPTLHLSTMLRML